MKKPVVRFAVQSLVLALLAIARLVNASRAEDTGPDIRQKILAALETARDEFLNRGFLEDEKLVLSDVYLAEQSRRTSNQALESAKSLAEKQVITRLQLESAAQAAQNAELRLETAQGKLKSLRESKTQILQQFDRLERMIREIKAK